VHESLAAKEAHKRDALRTAQRAMRARRANASASAPANEISTPAPSAGGAIVYVLPAGAVAREMPADGWCFVHAVVEQLRRLHADVPSSEVFLEACLAELLKLSDETLATKGVADGRAAVRQARTRYIEARDWNSPVTDLLIAYAAGARTASGRLRGWRAAGRGLRLPAGHGALDERVYRPEDAAANRMPAVEIHWHADHYRSVIPNDPQFAQRVRALPHGGVASRMPGGSGSHSSTVSPRSSVGSGLTWASSRTPPGFGTRAPRKHCKLPSEQCSAFVGDNEAGGSRGERRDDSLLGRARGEQRARPPRCRVQRRTRAGCICHPVECHPRSAPTALRFAGIVMLHHDKDGYRSVEPCVHNAGRPTHQLRAQSGDAAAAAATAAKKRNPGGRGDQHARTL